MRKPHLDMSLFASRRQKLGSLIKGSTLILSAQPDYIRNNDVHYPFRQDTNFFYLTGFEEPNSVLVFRPGQTPETILFVQPKNVEMETWHGFRYGPEGVKAHFGADEAYNIDELVERLPGLLKDSDKLYYQLYQNHEMDHSISESLQELKARTGRSGRGLLPVEDPRSLLGEMRIRKSLYEIEAIKKACELSSEAHVEVMKHTKPGINERALHGLFIKEIMERGAAREGYGAILAGGNNACTLHYTFNDCVLKDGDLLLIDAGGEKDYYTGDITRTYPVNGRFSSTQKRIYSSMLSLQKSVVKAVKPGVTVPQLQEQTISGLVDIMIEEKILKGSKEKLIESGEYRKFYPHNIGHWLGSDVHDAGLREVNGEPRPLEPCMCLTIEPGLYVPEDTPNVPEDVRGLGIRIEDNILVTESSNENLTAMCPKEVEELEALVGKSS